MVTSHPSPAPSAEGPADVSPPVAGAIYQKGSFARENSMGYLLRRIVNLMISEIDRRLEGQELTHAQWTPLFLIHRGQANTLAALARDLQVDAGALTRTLDRLEAKGLCTRERSADDRRVVHLALTPEGERAAAPVPGVLCDVSNHLLDGFTTQEWETLMGYLRRMVSNAEGFKAAAAAQACAHSDTHQES